MKKQRTAAALLEGARALESFAADAVRRSAAIALSSNLHVTAEASVTEGAE